MFIAILNQGITLVRLVNCKHMIIQKFVPFAKEYIGVGFVFRGQIKLTTYIWFKVSLDFFCRVNKIENKSFFTFRCPVDAGQGLNCFNTAVKLFIYIQNA